MICIHRGGGTGGVRGGRTPPRIRDLFSKIFEKSQKKNFFSIGPPPGKNRSPAPENDHLARTGFSANSALFGLAIGRHSFRVDFENVRWRYFHPRSKQPFLPKCSVANSKLHGFLAAVVISSDTNFQMEMEAPNIGISIGEFQGVDLDLTRSEHQ